MDNGRFGIIRAVKNAWIFTVAQRGYLARIGLLPLCLQAGTAVLLQQFAPSASMPEAFLWTLPANLTLAWFMFAEVRLLLLGERLDRLPQDEAFLQERRRAMKLSVIILLLLDMATGVLFFAWLAVSAFPPVARALSQAAMTALLLWTLRYSVAHVAAAVGYPLKDFLRRVQGPMFALRLAGMGLLCAMPLYYLLAVVLVSALPADGEPTAAQIMLGICISAPVSLLALALMNAAAVFALKEILGRGEGA